MTASSQIPNETQAPPPLIHLPTTQAVAMVRSIRSYDGLTVEAIAQGAVDQAQAEDRVELTRVRQDREALAWFHSRWKIAATLCEGRPLEYLLSVGEVLAALDGQMPTTLPLTMTWDGQVTGPDGDGPGEATFVPCNTSRGGRAVLALDDDQRLQLGEKLLATLHTTETCHTPGCGQTADELGGSGPPLQGWIRVQVAGVDGPARWWCTAWCANSAITAAGAELAALDQAAAVDPHAPVPGVRTAAVGAEEPVTYRPTPDTDTMALPAIAEALSGAARWFTDTAQDASGDVHDDAVGGAL
ncbi:hypothetical protein AB0H77_03580 [Streptomyces sp. NPDC050844]|uniref:hypothetical protein n=1 Tax=Streptomyces sp. NPDC050844 TaxID=3155790 RepID=UPI003410FCBB